MTADNFMGWVLQGTGPAATKETHEDAVDVALKHYPGAHDQSSHGNWAHDEAAGEARVLHQEAHRGGFSFRPDKDTPSTGFMVSDVGAEEISDARNFSMMDVRRYLKKYESVLRSDPNAYVGGWFDPESGKISLDISRHYRSHDEARAAAVKNKQKAYFDLEKMDSVEVGADEGRFTGKEGPMNETEKESKRVRFAFGHNATAEEIFAGIKKILDEHGVKPEENAETEVETGESSPDK